MILAPAWQWMSSMIVSVPAVICSGTCPCCSRGRDNPLQQLIGHLVTDDHLAMHPGFVAIQALAHKEYWSSSHGANYHRAYMCGIHLHRRVARICKGCVKGLWLSGLYAPELICLISPFNLVSWLLQSGRFLWLHCGYPFSEQWLSKTQWLMSHEDSVSKSHVRWSSNWNI